MKTAWESLVGDFPGSCRRTSVPSDVAVTLGGDLCVGTVAQRALALPEGRGGREGASRLLLGERFEHCPGLADCGTWVP